MPRLVSPSATWLELLASRDGVARWVEAEAEGLGSFALRQVAAGRWQRPVPELLVTHAGDLSARQTQVTAVLHGGLGAALAGEAALVAHGLTGWTASRVDVVAPRGVNPWKGARYRRVPTAPETLERAGVPCVLPAVAAVQAASWAITDKAAAALVRMAVSQGLTTALAVQDALGPRSRRRSLILRVLHEIAQGATTAAEAALLAAWSTVPGLPRLSTQVTFREPSGRTRRLDLACLPGPFIGLRLVIALELDGLGHLQVDQSDDDALRTIAAAEQGILVLRLNNHQVLDDPAAAAQLLLRVCRAWGWQG